MSSPSAHLSRESCEEVAQVIRQVQPDVIFMELCSARQGVVDIVEQEVGAAQNVCASVKCDVPNER